MAVSQLKIIEEHYEECWRAKGDAVNWKRGPSQQLPPGFCVLVFPPRESREMWTYATCGMSNQGDATPMELHLFSPVCTEEHVELLTIIAHYHLTGAYLNVGHTVNFGRSWLPQSKCDHGLISLPYLDGAKLEWLETSGRSVRFLWLVPITGEEMRFKKAHGLEALESRFEERKLQFLDPKRVSVT